MLTTGKQMLEEGGVGQTRDGKVAFISGHGGRGEEEKLRARFTERHDDETVHTVSRAARGWEQGMYRDSKAAPLIQYAMQQTGNDTTPEYRDAQRAQETDVSDEDIAAMQAISEHTTERLREAFGDEVTVFRGFAKNPHQGTPSEGTDVVEQMEQAKERGESVNIEHRPVESWTLNPEVASLYGAGGAVVKQTIPVEQVAMSSTTGWPDESEEDTVVMHDGPQEYAPDQIILDDEKSSDEMKFNLQAEAVSEAS